MFNVGVSLSQFSANAHLVVKFTAVVVVVVVCFYEILSECLPDRCLS